MVDNRYKYNPDKFRGTTMVEDENTDQTIPTQEILTTGPTVHSFITRFVFCILPVLVSVFSIFLQTVFRNATPDFIPNQAIFLFTPIGLFIVLLVAGWVLYIRELWAGIFSVLVLSIICAGITLMGMSLFSFDYYPRLIELLAFYIPIFSVIISLIMIAITEQYRRSIQYTITNAGIKMRGGIIQIEEHMIPFNQIGRIIMEVGILGRLFHFGTIIPIGVAQWGSELGIRGVGVGGQKGKVSAGVLYAKARQEVARTPLNCLLGVPKPHEIHKILEKFISRQALQGEEQTQYLKKIYEKL
jgi:membrane protein YdbS with pleckstrin-like domain